MINGWRQESLLSSSSRRPIRTQWTHFFLVDSLIVSRPIIPSPILHLLVSCPMTDCSTLPPTNPFVIFLFWRALASVECIICWSIECWRHGNVILRTLYFCFFELKSALLQNFCKKNETLLSSSMATSLDDLNHKGFILLGSDGRAD